MEFIVSIVSITSIAFIDSTNSNKQLKIMKYDNRI